MLARLLACYARHRRLWAAVPLLLFCFLVYFAQKGDVLFEPEGPGGAPALATGGRGPLGEEGPGRETRQLLERLEERVAALEGRKEAGPGGAAVKAGPGGEAVVGDIMMNATQQAERPAARAPRVFRPRAAGPGAIPSSQDLYPSAGPLDTPGPAASPADWQRFMEAKEAQYSARGETVRRYCSGQAGDFSRRQLPNSLVVDTTHGAAYCQVTPFLPKSDLDWSDLLRLQRWPAPLSAATS
jgi:hypothetical protein